MRQIRLHLAIAACFAVLCCGQVSRPAQAETGLARHKQLYAVPTPGAVVIDGKFDDWDLSGQIDMFVVSESKETQSARFAVMYDAEALYLSAVERDTWPLMNRQDPKVKEADWSGSRRNRAPRRAPSYSVPVRTGASPKSTGSIRSSRCRVGSQAVRSSLPPQSQGFQRRLHPSCLADRPGIVRRDCRRR